MRSGATHAQLWPTSRSRCFPCTCDFAAGRAAAEQARAWWQTSAGSPRASQVQMGQAFKPHKRTTLRANPKGWFWSVVAVAHNMGRGAPQFGRRCTRSAPPRLLGGKHGACTQCACTQCVAHEARAVQHRTSWTSKRWGACRPAMPGKRLLIIECAGMNRPAAGHDAASPHARVGSCHGAVTAPPRLTCREEPGLRGRTIRPNCCAPACVFAIGVMGQHVPAAIAARPAVRVPQGNCRLVRTHADVVQRQYACCAETRPMPPPSLHESNVFA